MKGGRTPTGIRGGGQDVNEWNGCCEAGNEELPQLRNFKNQPLGRNMLETPAVDNRWTRASPAAATASFVPCSYSQSL
jgi:hypothetical protein